MNCPRPGGSPPGTALVSPSQGDAPTEPKTARLIFRRYRLFNGLDIEFAEPDWDALPLLAAR